MPLEVREMDAVTRPPALVDNAHREIGRRFTDLRQECGTWLLLADLIEALPCTDKPGRHDDTYRERAGYDDGAPRLLDNLIDGDGLFRRAGERHVLPRYCWQIGLSSNIDSRVLRSGGRCTALYLPHSHHTENHLVTDQGRQGCHSKLHRIPWSSSALKPRC